MQKFHFISGLPRSGSTLLSAILKQNPRFTAGITDALHGITHSILQHGSSPNSGMSSVLPKEKQRELIRSIFSTYYGDIEVSFNTNRCWQSDTPLLKDLFPNFKMIVCVREVEWIVDSFETLHSKNPYDIKPIYGGQDLINAYQRSAMLMGQVQGFPNGVVSGPWDCLKNSMYTNERDHLLYVEYETLAKYPRHTMQQIYKFIGEPWFEHDFNNVEDSYDEYDNDVRIPGLHTVKKKVEFKQRRSILPDDLFVNLQDHNFWKKPEFMNLKPSLNWVLPPNQQTTIINSQSKLIYTNKQL